MKKAFWGDPGAGGWEPVWPQADFITGLPQAMLFRARWWANSWRCSQRTFCMCAGNRRVKYLRQKRIFLHRINFLVVYHDYTFLAVVYLKVAISLLQTFHGLEVRESSSSIPLPSSFGLPSMAMVFLRSPGEGKALHLNCIHFCL